MHFVLVNTLLFLGFLLSARAFKLLDTTTGLAVWFAFGVIMLIAQAIFFIIKKGMVQSLLFTVGMLVLAYVYYSGGYIGYSSFVAEGVSNKPTIEPGDDVVSRFFDLRLTPGVMVTVKLNSGKHLKRIHGIPGDEVTICGRYVYVNNIANYLKGGVWIKEHINKRASCSNSSYTIKLSDDEYYLMGDNFKNSYDSRNFGAVKRENLIAMHLYLLREDTQLSLAKGFE